MQYRPLHFVYPFLLYIIGSEAVNKHVEKRAMFGQRGVYACVQFFDRVLQIKIVDNLFL